MASNNYPDRLCNPLAGTGTPPRVIAVASGRGGVGKTNIAASLAMALVAGGQRTLLLDADLGMGNVGLLLGLSPRFTLSDVAAGRCALTEAIVEGPGGLLVAPAAAGHSHMAALSPAEHIGLIHAFSEIQFPLDAMVIDTATGITDCALTFAQAAQDILVVVCGEPGSMAGALSLIRVLAQERGVKRARVVVNKTRSAAEGREVFGKLARASERQLDVLLDYAGAIPHDEWVHRAVCRNQAVVGAFPGSPAAVAFRELAQRIDQWEMPVGPRGGVEFFVERMFMPRAAA